MSKMASLQTARKGRSLRRLLFIQPVFRVWSDDKQQSTCAKPNPQLDQNASRVSDTVAVRTGCTGGHLPGRLPTSGGNMFRGFQWMSKEAPGFKVRGEDIDVLPSPATFYDTLKEQSRLAKKRIVISSLYLGTGKLEKDLVNELHEAQTENPDLKVSILLDYTRGSRGKESSRTMLLPLVRDFGGRARVSLYHTPELRGFLKWVLPERFNEAVGVQHIKVYLFDDNLLISGANLSDSYFTNRQDRYMLLRNCGALGDYCEKLITSIAAASFQLQSDNSVKMEDFIENHPYKGKDNGEAFKKEFRSYIDRTIDPVNWTQAGFSEKSTFPHGALDRCNSGIFISNGSDSSTDSTLKDNSVRTEIDNSENTQLFENGTADSDDVRSNHDDCDTWVFPLIQMNQFGINIEEGVTQRLWRDASEQTQIFLASGYLNLPTHYENVILKECSAIFNIITAHPKANGFLGAAGIAGLVPSVYTLVTRQFYQQVRDLIQRHRVHIIEYQRPGWTFHGKGLWYYPPGQSLPELTLIGSPNFGHRSVYRDLEAQFAIVTENSRLQDQLHKEQQYLFKRGTEVTKQTFEQSDRHVPQWVQWFTRFCRSFF